MTRNISSGGAASSAWPTSRQRQQIWGAHGSGASITATAEPPEGLSTPSFWAVLAEGFVRAFGSEPYIATEWRAVRGWPGGMDLSMPIRRSGELRWVPVDADGEGHSTQGWQGTSATEQQRRDREKDNMAWDQNLMSVRLHHQDIQEWPRVLRKAAWLAARPRRARFTLYTKSYGQLGWTSRSEPL